MKGVISSSATSKFLPSINSPMAAQLKEAFGEATLYEIFGVERSAKPATIKKAYYKAALKYVRDSPPTACSPWHSLS